MTSGEDIRRYTAEELRAMKARGEDLTDWGKVAAMTQEELDHLISEDPDERTFEPDWTRAELVVPEAKRFIQLRLEQDIIGFGRTRGIGGAAASAGYR